MKKKKTKISEDNIVEYFKSKEFRDGITKQIQKDTWDQGLPMVYMNDKGQIVEHWKDGKIKIIKDNEKI